MRIAASADSNEESRWKNLCRVGCTAALTLVGIMVVQIIILVLWPPPKTVQGFFALMQDQPLLGLLSMDLLYILNNALLVLIYLALFFSLWRSSQPAVLITMLLGAGQPLLAIYKGTAFDTYYVLNAAALLIFAMVMLRSKVFLKTTGGGGLASGILMLLPSKAGTLGLIISLASLVPWAIFSVMVAWRFFQMGGRSG